VNIQNFEFGKTLLGTLALRSQKPASSAESSNLPQVFDSIVEHGWLTRLAVLLFRIYRLGLVFGSTIAKLEPFISDALAVL
jgi:hypothetical protein